MKIKNIKVENSRLLQNSSLVILKIRVDGKSQVITTVLTTEQMIVLEKEPVLMTRSEDILSLVTSNNKNFN
ncbi:hypothetical protein [Glaciecola sp. MF2-115]|uniref:hypothetical protein n=1 Tax=Glaciecola sp. MF2-115 TaxID=3384827 RepID=UPI0039A06D28